MAMSHALCCITTTHCRPCIGLHENYVIGGENEWLENQLDDNARYEK